jgi:hypothetical protein
MISLLIIAAFIAIIFLWPSSTVKARVCAASSSETVIMRVDPCCVAGDIIQLGDAFYTVLEIIPRKKRKPLSPEARERMAVTVAVTLLIICIFIGIDFCAASLAHLKVSRLGILITHKAAIIVAISFLVSYVAILAIVAKYARHIDRIKKAQPIYS